MFDYPMRSSIIRLAHSIFPPVKGMMEFFIVLLCESYTNCYTNYHLLLGETFCSLTSNFSRLNIINDLYYNVFVLFIYYCSKVKTSILPSPPLLTPHTVPHPLRPIPGFPGTDLLSMKTAWP